jgi:hypothetical protein
MSEVGVRFRGLKALDRALSKADKSLRTKLRDRLREAADIVAVEAREIAESKGLRDSGDLIRGIQPYALTGRAGVRSGAVHDGFAYPRRLEYEGGAGGAYGPRAHLNPAVERKENEILSHMEGLLDTIEHDFEGTA